jgi:SAM-dependent methyltransferase
MIHQIPHEVSDALRKECEAHAQAAAVCTAEVMRRNAPTADDFLRDFLARPEGAQLLEAVRPLPAGARILDVGAGFGLVAVTLATRGFRVGVVEPALALCGYIERAATLYGLDIDIYHVSAECMDRVPADGFDACLFHASLHHCDDPVRALANARGLLAPGGRVLLLNEPLLQAFRTRAWFQRQLDSGTLVTGDYGGNEHIYYYHEYRAMLRRAGFEEVRDSVALRYRDPQSYLAYLASSSGGRASLTGRRVYYGLVRGLTRAPLAGPLALGLLKRLSLVQTNFTAVKPAA